MSFPNLFNKKEREAWYKTESFRKTGLSVSDVENLVQSEEEKIQGLKPSPDKNVVIFSKKRELDRKLGYAAESIHSPAEHTGNRSTFIGNEPAYSTAANNASNDTFTEKTTQNAQTSSESRAAYTVQPTGEDWNAAAETGASYTSVHSREDGSSAKKTGQNPSQPRGDISGQTKQMLTPEQEEAARLERMNANYEHDKAVLAKADPMFARNQFWDVGHAEGSGEESDREIKRATKKLQENMLEKIKGKQL